MKEKEYISTLYIYEQNLLKSCTNILLDSSSEIMHDYILNIFDEVDDLTRKLYKYLLQNEFIKKDYTSKKKKDNLYEELDSLYLRINE